MSAFDSLMTLVGGLAAMFTLILIFVSIYVTISKESTPAPICPVCSYPYTGSRIPYNKYIYYVHERGETCQESSYSRR